MPIPHLEIRIVQRSKGSSAVAGAAYQAGEKLFSEYDQKMKNYLYKKEVVYTEVMLPTNAPPGYADRATLWNAAEEVEKQWNSQLARRFVVALPREAPTEMYPQMMQEYCQEHFVSKGMCCDFAIHDPDPPGHNPHCHIMLTMRAIDENGKWLPKSRKVYDLDENGERIRLPSGNWKSHKEDTVDWNEQYHAEEWRHGWELVQNKYLELAGSPERVDMRSYERQGLDKIPTVHMGAAVCALERKGIETNIGNLNRDIKAANRMMNAIRSTIQNLRNWIVDIVEATKEAFAEVEAQPKSTSPDLVSEAREDDPEFQSPVDLMFERLEQKDPDHFAVRQYKKFLLSAGKTRSSILISCGARLAPFDIREVRELMEDDEMELDTIGDEKTVLFLIMSDTDTTFNFILAMLQSQLINLLCDRADDKYGGRLPVHVRLILDEFANIGQIPNFDKLIATIRSREISDSIILQSQSQLKAIYKDAAEIISDNCDSMLFLSGRGKNAKEISDALGKETIDSFNTSENRGSQTSHGLNYQKLGKELMSQDEIAVMDGGKCILQLRGVRPFLSEKFDITKHPRYKYLADADKKNSFDVDRFLTATRRKRQQVVTQDEIFDLYEIDLSDEDAAAE